MSAFLYGVGLQLRMDIRSKTMLITCYVVPLLFFALMGGIFTSVDPNAKLTLIPSMSVFVATMGASVGLPPALTEIYGSNIKKVYKANGVPLALGVVTHYISAFIHLAVVCLIVFAVAPFAFGASLPADLPRYFAMTALYIAAALGVGCVLGVLCRSQSMLTMLSQLVFLPSVMLSGIMFPASLLPAFLRYAGYALPATIGFRAMTDFRLWHVFALLGALAVAAAVTALRLRTIAKR